MPVRIADYPQLKLLAWNRNADAFIDEQDAFALYEREWRWVEQAALLPHERALIDSLTQRYGHGVMNV
jgi:hypothetical protein